MKPEEKHKLRQQLIEIYEGYIKNNKDYEVMKKAQKLFFDYLYLNDIPDRDLMTAVHGLEHIGWEFSRGLQNPSVNWKMNEAEAKDILNKLRV